MANSRGVGTLELSNPPERGQKKRANAPSSVNTARFFIDRTVEWCRFKQFNVRFFVSINVVLESVIVRFQISNNSTYRLGRFGCQRSLASGLSWQVE